MAPLRPYEVTHHASFHNPFVKALYSNRQHWMTFLAKKKRGIRPATMLHDLKVAVGYINVAIEMAETNSVLTHDHRSDKFIPLMWKHWIAHRAWTMGSLALIKVEIESIESTWAPLEGEEETKVSCETRAIMVALNEKVRQSYNAIAALQFFCTDRDWTDEERAMYGTNFREMEHILEMVERKAQVAEIVVDRLAGQLRDVLNKLFTYKSAQIEYSEAKTDRLVRAFRALQGRGYDGDQMGEIEQRMKELTYLDPNSTFNNILDRKVEESIKMCKEYEEMDIITKACCAMKDAASFAVAEARRNLEDLFKNSAKNLLSCLWTACKAISWPVVAPVLGIKDAFCNTNSFTSYNDGIKEVFWKNPWTMSLMMIGLFGGIAVGGYFLLPGVVGSIAIGQGAVVGTLLCGGSVGFAAGYYIEHRRALLAVKAKEEEEQKVTEHTDAMMRDMPKLIAERSAKSHRFNDKRHKQEKGLADDLSAVYAKRRAEANDSESSDDDCDDDDPTGASAGSRGQLPLPPTPSNPIPPSASSPVMPPIVSALHSMLASELPQLSDPDTAKVDKPLTEADINTLERELNQQVPHICCNHLMYISDLFFQVNALQGRLDQMTAESEEAERSARELDAIFQQMQDELDINSVVA